jgi:hypothetical protein
MQACCSSPAVHQQRPRQNSSQAWDAPDDSVSGTKSPCQWFLDSTVRSACKRALLASARRSNAHAPWRHRHCTRDAKACLPSQDHVGHSAKQDTVAIRTYAVDAGAGYSHTPLAAFPLPGVWCARVRRCCSTGGREPRTGPPANPPRCTGIALPEVADCSLRTAALHSSASQLRKVNAG